MENIKFYAVTFLLIIGAGFLGYGAISSLRDPVYYVNNQTALTTVGDLKQGTPVTPAADAIAPEPPADTTTTPATPVTAAAPVADTKPVAPATADSKNADLVARLQKISGTLKKGASGDSVKAVQEALNIVAKAGLPTSGTGYGTFGAGTEAAVKKFQTSAKLPSTGQVASKTIAALVDKLK